MKELGIMNLLDMSEISALCIKLGNDDALNSEIENLINNNSNDKLSQVQDQLCNQNLGNQS